MKVAVTGDCRDILRNKLPNGFELNDSTPDIVLSFGGDGTLLLSEDKYKILEFNKLDLLVNGKKEFTAMNDISLHFMPPRAVRFSLKVNNKLICKEIIGDGFIVSTNFGS